MKRPTKEMRFASNNLERIKEAIDRNKNLSSDPTDMHNGQTQESILNLRPFDKSKVINQSNPSFKFKPATSIERVYETIQNSRNLAPSDLADKTLLNNRSTKKLQLKSQNLNKTLNVPSYSVSPREMHKGLHQKTHFKAVYEMFVNPVYGDRVKDESLKKAIRIAPTLDQVRNNPGLVNSQYSDNWLNTIVNNNIYSTSNQANQITNLEINEKELAKQLLRNCNYLRSSKRNISLDNSSSIHSITQYNTRKQELIRDISKYKNIREDHNQTTLLVQTSKSKLDPFDQSKSYYENSSIGKFNIDKKQFRFKRQSHGINNQNKILLNDSMRFVHPRGYNDFYDSYTNIFHETNFALMGAKETEQFAYVLDRFGNTMTDTQLAYMFQYIGRLQLDKSKGFWEKILPAVKKQLATLDRNCTKSLYHFIEGASQMKLQDNEFWELVEQKLVDERLHRYFELEKLTNILVLLAEVGRGSDEMIEIVEKTLIKHRRAITPEIADTAREGFRLINKGSEILYRVLDDPNTELPALE
eukprot:403369108